MKCECIYNHFKSLDVLHVMCTQRVLNHDKNTWFKSLTFLNFGAVYCAGRGPLRLRSHAEITQYDCRI